MELLILVILILLNGIFAMSEIALVTARKARLTTRASAGDKAAAAAIRLGEDPTRFLSTIQIGITSIGLLSGIVGESALAAPLGQYLQDYTGLSPATCGIIATVVVVATITYLSIVIGELVPKRLGQIHPEGMACLVARPMNILSIISRPFVVLLSSSTRGLLRLLGINPDEHQAVTEEEIQAMIDEGSESGIIEHEQQAMLKNIFRLDDRPVSSIMRPRSDMAYLDTQLSPEENKKRLIDYDYSWFPVCQDGPDNLLGVVHAKDALLLLTENRFSELTKHIFPPVFVPETLTSLELLTQFQTRGMHIAFIVDEYGTMGGLVTIRDILEILTGQINVPIEEAWAIRRENGSWLMDGTIPILEMKDRLSLKSVPDEEKGSYTVLAGMLMYMMGKIPREGDHVVWEGWKFEVMDMDGNKIDKVLVERIDTSAPDQENAASAQSEILQHSTTGSSNV